MPTWQRQQPHAKKLKHNIVRSVFGKKHILTLSDEISLRNDVRKKYQEKTLSTENINKHKQSN